MVLSFLFGPQIVKFYARNDSNPDLILEQARFYMPIIIVSFLPLGLTTAINSGMREIGEAKKVLISSSISVAVNIIGNAIFIYAFHGVKGRFCNVNLKICRVIHNNLFIRKARFHIK